MKNYCNNSRGELISLALKNGEVEITNNGMISAITGKHTGRAANDKFIVFDSATENTVDWSTNKKFDPNHFDSLAQKVSDYVVRQKAYVQTLRAGVGESKLNFTVASTTAWHALFAQTMFYKSNADECEWVIIHVPDFKADPKVDHTNSDAFIIINFTEKIVLIGGTHYAGEIKKSVFTILNYLLPEKGILPMHSSVNVSDAEQSTIFFGLSGTGKTTLSADKDRVLIGDDEHGWREDGAIFNFEDGCYAKAIKLSEYGEPEIWNAVHQFGTVLENVKVIRGECDFDDSSLTENTRAAYKLANISNASTNRITGAASNIIMLACDSYGVLPPLSKLTPEQAAYYFLSGYTAKVAGTEAGVKEPTATFSACFGAPFLPRPPTFYADMLIERIKKYKPNVWLVNTGWTGGPYGTGKRINLAQTRDLVDFALEQNLDAKFETHEVFGFSYLTNLSYPTSHSEAIPSEVLNPALAWYKNGVEGYLTQAQELADKFKNNFKKYESQVSSDILNAGPK